MVTEPMTGMVRGVASTILHEQGWPHEHIELQLGIRKKRSKCGIYHALYRSPEQKDAGVGGSLGCLRQRRRIQNRHSCVNLHGVHGVGGSNPLAPTIPTLFAVARSGLGYTSGTLCIAGCVQRPARFREIYDVKQLRDVSEYLIRKVRLQIEQRHETALPAACA